MPIEENFCIKYAFKFSDGRSKKYIINIDPEKLVILDKLDNPSDWTALDHFQCSNCPLSGEEHRHCPAALAVQNLIEHFSEDRSFEDVDVLVAVPERTYGKRTTLQEGLRSMLGILMPVSGCPVLAPLRPMVRFHLPFGSSKETLFRSAATYLVAQYFRNIERKSPDWHFEKLAKIYEQIHQTNIHFAKRIHSIIKEDATANSLVILDIFAQSIPFSIELALKEIEYLFDIYLKNGDM